MHRNSRIFIAGHKGLIGSACMRRFQSQGYTQLLYRLRSELELSDRDALFDFFSQYRPEYVILAAGKVGGILENTKMPADFMTQNLQIQLNVFAAAHKFGAKRVLFFGSSCMYPRECPQPIQEDALLSGKPEPTSLPYALAKLAGLQLCISYNAQYGANLFIPLIPNSVYGMHDNFDPATGHVLSVLIHRFHAAKIQNAQSVTLWGSGTPKREFLFADDLAAACERILISEDVHLPINIGSGMEVSISELAELIAHVIGYDGQILWDSSKPDGAPRKLLHNGRMKSLGWAAETSLEEGIRHTYGWYKDWQDNHR